MPTEATCCLEGTSSQIQGTEFMPLNFTSYHFVVLLFKEMQFYIIQELSEISLSFAYEMPVFGDMGAKG